MNIHILLIQKVLLQVIHIIRDPKDVFCSIYEHAKQMHFRGQNMSSRNEPEKFQSFLEGFIKVSKDYIISTENVLEETCL